MRGAGPRGVVWDDKVPGLRSEVLADGVAVGVVNGAEDIGIAVQVNVPPVIHPRPAIGEMPGGPEGARCFGLDVPHHLADVAIGVLDHRVNVIAKDRKRVEAVRRPRDCIRDNANLGIAKADGRELERFPHLALKVPLIRVVRERSAGCDCCRGTKPVELVGW